MSTGWSCGTLEEGYKAVVTEEEEDLLKAQEAAILQEIKDWVYTISLLVIFNST